jgi:hypothetical protein
MLRLPVMPKKKPGPKPNPLGRRTVITNIRSSTEWREWVDEFATFAKSSVSDLVDRALIGLARELKFPKQAPKR